MQKTAKQVRKIAGWASWAGAVALTLTGCGGAGSGGPNPAYDVKKLAGVEYIALDRANLNITDTAVSGQGKVIFLQPHDGAGGNFDLTFTLPEKGAVTLFTNSDDKLQSAIAITLARPQGKEFSAKFQIGSETYDFAADYASELATIPADQPISVEIDVHTHGDVILEVGGKKMGAEFKTSRGGKYWGLALNGASVTSAGMGKIKFPH